MNNRSKYSLVCLLLVGLLLLGLPALAKGRKSLTIYDQSRLNDTVLEPGQYKVEIAENGSGTELMLYKGKKLVAKSPVQAEKMESKADRNALKFTLEQGKAPKIIEIRLSGEELLYKINEGEKQIGQRIR